MNESKIYKINSYGKTFDIRLDVTSYMNSHFAITMSGKADDENWWEPYDTLTTNFPESRSEGSYAYVQEDKYLDFVLENKLGVKTGNVIKSGFNTYVEIYFNEDI